MTLNRRYLRNFKSSLSFYISTGLITALVVYMFIAMSASYKAAKEHVDKSVRDTVREDGQFTLYNEMTDSDITDFEQEYNVTIDRISYKETEVLDGADSDKPEVTLRLFAPPERVDRYELSGGDDLSSDDEILINEQFANACGIKIGDSLTLASAEGQMKFKVAGFMIRYDYFFCLKNPNDTFSVSTEYGIAQLTQGAFDKLTGGSNPHYYAIKYSEDNETEVRRELYNRFMTSGYVPAALNNRIQTPEDELKSLETMSYVILPAAILFVVILIAAVLGRKVKNELKMIGILNALGYRRGELAVHYSLFGAIPGLIGGALGVLLGLFATEPMVGVMFESKMEPLPISYGTAPADIIIGIAAPTLCYTAAVFLTALLTVKGSAIEMIKGTGSKHRRFSLRLAGLKAHFRTKYKLRMIFGSFGRTLTVIFGLTVGGLLLSFCLACVDSLQNYVDKSVDELGSYEYEYFLNTVLLPEGTPDELMPDAEAQQRIRNAIAGTNAEEILSASFAVEGSSDYLTLMGMDDNPYMRLETTDGETLTEQDGKYYLSSMGAMIYGVEEGGELTFSDISSMQEHTVRIDKIFDCGSQNLLVTTNATAAETVGSLPAGSCNCIMSESPIALEEGDVLKSFTKQSLKKQLEENVLDSMKQMMSAVYILGGLLLVTVVFLMVNVILSENLVNISMLKVLGYHDNEINRIMTHVYHVVAFIGITLGLAAGYIADRVNFEKSAAVYNCYVDNKMTLSSVLIYYGVSLLSYALALILLGRKTGRVSMVESLKDNRE